MRRNGCPTRAERTSAGEAGRSDRPTALLVDDDEAMLGSCPQVLEREGFQVIAVSDGPSALEVMHREPTDIVILDLKMPGMSGEEVFHRVKEIDPEAVVIVVTGYPKLRSAVDVMKAGVYDFLPKPFGAEELRIIARRALERRKLALAVAASEREKQHMRDNFVAMVSHQLKSPAASLKECLDAAAVSCAGQMPPQSADLLQRAAGKAQLLLDLMDDWVTLARAESGGLTVSSELLDLCELLKRAVAVARGGIDHNDVEVRLDCEEERLQIEGDPEALQEMFVNLIDNAMRYTPDGGTALVRVSAKGECALVEGECALVSVEDTGPGIPAEELGLIFEPFFRSDAAKKKHGTGLGLAIVKQIVEAHGGRIEVKTAPGQGSAFLVLLPAGGRKKPTAQPEPTKRGE